MISVEEKNKLIEKAIVAKQNAYSPYSQYSVGASLLSDKGIIYIGSNFENAAVGAGVCAERVALGSALSAGERLFKAICVCGNSFEITPCGICRQALSEFNDIDVICCNENGESVEYRLSEILPKSFNSDNLKF